MATSDLLSSQYDEQEMVFETLGRLQKMLPVSNEEESFETDEFSILLSAIEYIQWLSDALKSY